MRRNRLGLKQDLHAHGNGLAQRLGYFYLRYYLPKAFPQANQISAGT